MSNDRKSVDGSSAMTENDGAGGSTSVISLEGVRRKREEDERARLFGEIIKLADHLRR
jgi:hypothetical protein